MNNTSPNSNNCSSILLAIKEEKLKVRTEAEQNQGYLFVIIAIFFSFNQQNRFFFKDSDFVNINPRDNVFWTILFTNYFLCFDAHKDNSLTHDDLVFLVSKFDVEEVKEKTNEKLM